MISGVISSVTLNAHPPWHNTYTAATSADNFLNALSCLRLCQNQGVNERQFTLDTKTQTTQLQNSAFLHCTWCRISSCFVPILGSTGAKIALQLRWQMPACQCILQPLHFFKSLCIGNCCFDGCDLLRGWALSDYWLCSLQHPSNCLQNSPS